MTATKPMPESVVVRPAVERWAEALSRARREGAARATRFREQLGLPVHRPIVMTGHQAQFWHPGILAKFIAAQSAARRFGATPAWLVVDQDTNDPFEVRFPVRLADGRLESRLWHAAGKRGDAPDVLSGRMPAAEPGAVPVLAPAEFAAAGVGEGLARIRAALAASAEQPNAARQVASALADLLGGVGIGSAPTAFATDVSRTDLFVWIVDRMRADAPACVAAYNRAVEEFPDTGVHPLVESHEQRGPEVPLWRIGPAMGSPRRRVFAADLAAAPIDELVPRALLMTGLMRLGACDLFIHGLGGGGEVSQVESPADPCAAPGHHHKTGYDHITDRWFAAWLGERPAPSAVVTATLRLGIDAADAPAPEAIDRAVWTAHRAEHDPAMLGDDLSAARKRELVESIRRAKKMKGAAAGLYKRMHSMLAEARTAHGAALDDLRRRAVEAAARREDASVIADRTWPFPLYDPAQLSALHRAVSLEITV